MSSEKAAKWLEQTLGYRFADPAWLDLALSHRSATGQSNERLEFLGDAILDFVISAAVFSARPAADEGDLSRLRAALVNDRTLARLATELGIGEYIRLGSGEKKTGGHRRASIMADALEALFGAIYCDRGLAAAEDIIRTVYADELSRLPDADSLKDPKTRLQERLQAAGMTLPEYEVSEVSGKPHKRHFTVICEVPALGLSRQGEGSSRRKAEQAAAGVMLEALDKALAS